MNWKLTAGWMFVAVVMAEIAVTVGLEIFPFFRLADQHASYFDVAAACFSTAVIFVFLRWISRRGSRALLPGDLLSGGVVLIATAGFESVLEPLSLGMGRSWPEVNVAALNGFKM